MLTVNKNGNWQLYWGVMPLPDGAETFGVVKRDSGTGALIKLASGNYVQGNAGGFRTLDQKAVKDALSRSDAAAALGSKGGSVMSKAKAEAARENGRKGGRPKKQK